MRSRALGFHVMALIVFVFLVPVQLVAVAWFGGAGWVECAFLIAAYFFVFLLVGWMAMVWQERGQASLRKRKRQLFPKAKFLEQEKQRKSAHWGMLAIVVTSAAMVVYLAYLLEPDRLLPSSIRTAAAFVWGVLLLFFWMLIARYMLIRSASHAMLVRSLASACATAQIASPAEWRSAHYRRRTAAHLGEAASIVEGPVLGILAGIPVPSRTPEWRQVRGSATSLRRLAARVVTRGPDGWLEIERSLTTAVATAVAGALVTVESDTPPEEDAPVVSRLSTLLRSLRNLVVALLPAIGVGALILGGERYAWEWAQEARPLLIQFAVVSVLIGLMSALDPAGYQQRLNAITGAGGSMFGRRG